MVDSPTFDEYKKYIQSLGIKSREEFRKATPKFPPGYSKDPDGFYKKQGTWKGWNDLCGTKQHFLKNAPSYDVYKKYLQSLGIKSREEFGKATPKFPTGYSKDPNRFYLEKGWKDWPDLFGTKQHFLKNAPSYDVYKKYIQSLGIKSREEFRKATPKFPTGYSKDPGRFYLEKGWKDWLDLFGKESPFLTNAPTFDVYKKYIQSLGIKSKKEFVKFDKSRFPDDYSKDPDGFYKKQGTWKGWNDLFGTRQYFLKNAPSYDVYKKYIQSLGIKSKLEFVKFDKSRFPAGYSKAAEPFYKKQGTWKGWNDLCGTKQHFLKNAPSYDVYKKYIQSLGIKSKKEFVKFDKSRFPAGYSTAPRGFYLEKGWISWFDLLGKEDVRVTVTNLQKFVKSLLDSKLLDGNVPAGFDYYLMMKNKNLNLNTAENRKLIRTLVDLSETPTGRKTLQEIADGNFRKVFGKLEKQLDNKADDPETQERITTDDKIHIQDYLTDNERESTSKIYEEADVFETITVDEESMKFIYRFFINRIWVNCFESEKEKLESIQIAKKELDHKNEVRRNISKTFLEEYEGATNLPIPPIKAKTPTGKPITPWLSQLFTAYKVTTEKHFANFSGTGAGKTLSAIIASKAIDAKMTVIICPNALIQNGQWKNEAERCFDGNHTTTGYNAFNEKYDKSKSKFLIINWDKLNQPGKSRELVETLAKQKIDLIVIDEIHFAKNVETSRFKNLGGLITKARRKNPDLKTLAMTATPIVNELVEGKTQLQLLTGTTYRELKTAPYTSNAIALWAQFTIVDIRHRPKYANVIIKELDVDAPIPSEHELQFLNRNPLAIEQFLTDYRIPEILKILKDINAPAIIYTDYVGAVKDLPNHKSITQKLANALQKEGYQFGFYTGKDKSGFQDFLDKKIDILIASNPIAVGVDKLQFRCKHLIFNSLPWTNARYRQIIGRIARPGQGDAITVYHVRGNFPAKAYDLREKLEKIYDKKRLADCAVDGENLPEGRLPSHQSVIKNTIDWLKRLQKGEVSYIERDAYLVELPKAEATENLRQRGNLEDMNQKFGQSNSQTIYEMAQKDPEFLVHYTRAQRESEKHLTINPTDYLIQQLKEMPEFWKICDMGCGLQNKIRKEFGSRVKSFDIGTYDIDELIPCDIADVSDYIQSGTHDVVIFSQSLMCKNWADMISEAARCLRRYGQLMIVIQTQQWKKRIDDLYDELDETGFELIGEPKTKGEFTFIDALKTRKKRL